MKKNLFFFMMLILNLSNSFVNSARYLSDQGPLSIPTDPDVDRPLGRCNQDSDCSPGSDCTSFGWCENR